MLRNTVEQPPVRVIGKRSILDSYDTPHFRLCQILPGARRHDSLDNQTLGDVDHRTVDERSQVARDV